MTPARLPIRGYARTAFESRIAELAADPDGHGLDADEAVAYRLAARCCLDGALLFAPAEREELRALLTEIANAEDDTAEDRGVPADVRRMARATRDGLSTLARRMSREESR